jgi:hypothetical protein
MSWRSNYEYVSGLPWYVYVCVCGRLVSAVVNWSVTPTVALCSVILDVRVSLLEMKTECCVERKIWWPDENER